MTTPMIAVLDGIEQRTQAAWLRQRSYELLHLTSGDRVLDAGCGTGRAVSELTGHRYIATGVDLDEDMITHARAQFPECDFRVASAEAPPYDNGTFRGYRADKLVHAFADPTDLLAEAHRVLLPGARVVLLGQDWDHIAIEASDISITRDLVHAMADTIAAPRAARRYRNALLDHGFTDVAVEVHTDVITDHQVLAPILAGFAEAGAVADVVDRDDAEAWVADQERRGRENRFLVEPPIFVTSATAP